MTMRLLCLCLFSILKVAAVSANPAHDKIAQRFSEPFPGYDTACGYPIMFRRVTTISLARIDERLGPIVVLDPLLLYPAQDAHRRFLIAHECAHHRMGHTKPQGLHERTHADKGVENQELSADCWAAEALVRAGFRDDVRFIADLFFRKGLVSPGGGYPSGVQRSTLIYHCLKSMERPVRKTTEENESTAAE